MEDNKSLKKADKDNTACFISRERVNRSSLSSLVVKLEKTVDRLVKQDVIFYGCGALGGYELTLTRKQKQSKIKL